MQNNNIYFCLAVYCGNKIHDSVRVCTWCSWFVFKSETPSYNFGMRHSLYFCSAFERKRAWSCEIALGRVWWLFSGASCWCKAKVGRRMNIYFVQSLNSCSMLWSNICIQTSYLCSITRKQCWHKLLSTLLRLLTLMVPFRNWKTTLIYMIYSLYLRVLMFLK